MIRFLAAMALFAMVPFLLLSPNTTVNAQEPRMEPTPTVQPTSDPFEVDVVVETLGFGIPDNVVMETDFGNRTVYAHESIETNHYRDHLKVHLDTSMIWIFDHEGNLSTENGTRNAESWQLFPVIVDTPFTMTLSLHNPATPCADPVGARCNNVPGAGERPVFILNQNKSYHINLRVDYSQDRFAVTSTLAVAVTTTPVPTVQPTAVPTAPAASAKVDLDKIFPAGKGRDLLLLNCSACHSFVRAVVGQRTKDAWEVVKRNMRSRVSGMSEQDFETVFAYLEANFDDTKPPPDLPDWLRSTW
jgi:mono/diheme cytochrome c family protein